MIKKLSILLIFAASLSACGIGSLFDPPQDPRVEEIEAIIKELKAAGVMEETPGRVEPIEHLLRRAKEASEEPDNVQEDKLNSYVELARDIAAETRPLLKAYQ